MWADLTGSPGFRPFWVGKGSGTWRALATALPLLPLSPFQCGGTKCHPFFPLGLSVHSKSASEPFVYVVEE
jgi:hypothetical protein